ncbi:hypothetical protein O1D18_003544 [Vibrio cholerae]|nr:hypothetical protein [Vibrio cholerae]HCJ6812908.1 hypothetical protein [Vibrio cholerae]HCJ7284838.1 hypothetical protein [Vibrio cholerae]HCJ7315274.1 hypothetical protein [Vibrio cholerae]HCJ7322739.1 hypothetical protein [Vibrio cholerae]
MNRLVKFLILTSVVPSVVAVTLDEIANFSARQCEEIHASGKMTESQISAKLQGEIKALNKLLGSVGANGQYTNSSRSYNGVPFDQIASQLTDVRTCKQNLTMAILSNTKLTSTSPAAEYYSLKERVILMDKPNFIERTKLTLAKDALWLEQGTRVNKLEHTFVDEEGYVPLTWRAIEVESGDYKGQRGWVLASDIVLQ